MAGQEILYAFSYAVNKMKKKNVTQHHSFSESLLSSTEKQTDSRAKIIYTTMNLSLG